MILIVKIILILLTVTTVAVSSYFIYKYYSKEIPPTCNENSDNNYTFSSPSFGKDILSLNTPMRILFSIGKKLFGNRTIDRKENFQLSTSIISSSSLLDLNKDYYVGRLNSNINPTTTPGINSTVTCSFPTNIYKNIDSDCPNWITVYSKGTFGSIDLGKDQTNLLFNDSLIFKRDCTDCVSTHKEIYYKRITPIPSTFSIYDQFNNWTSTNNVINIGFKLYSSYNDVLNDTNAWKFCNYDDPSIGFPRDCGITSAVGGQWNSLTKGGQPNIKYSVLNKSCSFAISSICSSNNPVIANSVYPFARTLYDQTSFINASTTANFSYNNVRSIACWVKLNSDVTDGERPGMMAGNYATSDGLNELNFEIHMNRKPRIYINRGGPGSFIADDILPRDIWIHIAFVIRDTSVDYYKNGKLMQSVALTSPLPIINWQNVKFGYDNRGGTWFGKFAIRNLIVSNTPFTLGDLYKLVPYKCGYKNYFTWKHPTAANTFVPLRLNENNDVECMSRNATDCFWVATKEASDTLINNRSIDSNNPIVCGSGAYNNLIHWCYLSMKEVNPTSDKIPRTG